MRATEAALLAGLIVADGGGHRFTHALVREAVYARLLRTGITVIGFAGHHVGLLARATGDLAADHFEAALRRNEEAGFWPFAAASARELAVLRQRDRPGDQGAAAALAARASRWVSGGEGHRG